MEDELERFYPGYASNRPKPTLFRDWPKEPFIKTGYTSPKLPFIPR